MALQWRDLLARVERPELGATPLWLRTWWDVFRSAGDRRLVARAYWQRGRLVGLAPLLVRTARHRGLVPLRRVELLATGEDEADEICTDYTGVLAERGKEALVAEALAADLADAADRGAWDDVVLTAVRQDDPVLAPLAEALEGRAGAHVTMVERTACPAVALPATWEAYVEMLDAKSRYLVTRALRELDKWSGGTHRLVRATNEAELARGVEVLHALHAARWKPKGHDGVFVRDRFRAFHDAVMPRMLAGEDGARLDLVWLEVKGRPVCVLYNVVFDGRVHVYQSGRVEDVPKNLRIGIAMNALCIRDAIARGLREYDFMSGLSQYKRQMSAGRAHTLVTLRAVAPRVRARALDGAARAADLLAERTRALRAELLGKRGAQEPAPPPAPASAPPAERQPSPT